VTIAAWIDGPTFDRLIDLRARREAARFDRATAYKRRRACRGRGTARGIGLAQAFLRRWRLSSPMYRRPAFVHREAAA